MNVAEIMRVTGEHVVIVLIAVVVAIAAGIPLGIWCTRRAAASHVVLRAVDVVQTIPSLALFGLLIPIPFIDLTRNYAYNAPNGGLGVSFGKGFDYGQNNQRLSMSYITGSHAFKVGGSFLEGTYVQDLMTINKNLYYNFTNPTGTRPIPSTITQAGASKLLTHSHAASASAMLLYESSLPSSCFAVTSEPGAGCRSR